MHLMRHKGEYASIREPGVHEKNSRCGYQECEDLGSGWIEFTATKESKCPEGLEDKQVEVLLRSGAGQKFRARKGRYLSWHSRFHPSAVVCYYRLVEQEEDLVICPNANTNTICEHCHHKEPHEKNLRCGAEHNPHCPACVPYEEKKKKATPERTFSEKEDTVRFLSYLVEDSACTAGLAAAARLINHPDGLRGMVEGLRQTPSYSKWLDEKGYVFEWEKKKVVHKYGNRYYASPASKWEFLLCQVASSMVCLVSVEGGHCWDNAISVVDAQNLNDKEWLRITGGNPFTLIEEKNDV